MHFFDSEKEIGKRMKERLLGIDEEIVQCTKDSEKRLKCEKDLLFWLLSPKRDDFTSLCKEANAKIAEINKVGNMYSQFDKYIEECKIMFTIYHEPLLRKPYIGRDFFLSALTRLRTTYRYLKEHPPMVTLGDSGTVTDNLDEIEIYSLSFFQTFKNILEILEKLPDNYRLEKPELKREIIHFRNFFAHSLDRKICKDIRVLAKVDSSGWGVGTQYYSLKLFDESTGNNLGRLHYSIDYFFLETFFIISEFCNCKLYDSGH